MEESAYNGKCSKRKKTNYRNDDPTAYRRSFDWWFRLTEPSLEDSSIRCMWVAAFPLDGRKRSIGSSTSNLGYRFLPLHCSFHRFVIGWVIKTVTGSQGGVPGMTRR